MGRNDFGAGLLMIGAGKMVGVLGVDLVGNYSVNLSPGEIEHESGKGSTTTATVYSTVIDGIGPFTYQWVIDNPEITINSPTGQDTSFTASGINETKIGTATLTVTDTGNANAETSKNVGIVFLFDIIGL